MVDYFMTAKEARYKVKHKNDYNIALNKINNRIIERAETGFVHLNVYDYGFNVPDNTCYTPLAQELVKALKEAGYEILQHKFSFKGPYMEISWHKHYENHPNDW